MIKTLIAAILAFLVLLIYAACKAAGEADAKQEKADEEHTIRP